MENYELIVKTNSYAGNFERELCAWMTGQIGECEVGEELVNPKIANIFNGIVRQESDDHGTFRPVKLDPTDANNCVIFFDRKLDAFEFDILNERGKSFEEKRPYEYLTKDFKFLGLSFERIGEKREAVTI